MSTQYKKHIIFTGGSSGIGYEATKVLAADPETHIVVLSRVSVAPTHPILTVAEPAEGPPGQRRVP